MASKLHELQELKIKTWEQMKELDKRAGEGDSQAATKFDELNKDISRINGEIEAEQASVAAAAERSKLLKQIEDGNREARNGLRVGVDAEERRRDNPEVEERERRDASNRFLRGYMQRLNGHVIDRRSSEESERRFAEDAKRAGYDHRSDTLDIRLGAKGWEISPIWSTRNGCGDTRESRVDAPMYIGGSNVGSQFVPQGFAGTYEKKLVSFDGPRKVCRVFRTTSGNSLPWPTVDDTGNSGALLAEATTGSDAVAATTGAITFSAYKTESKPILVSAELMEDEAVDFMSLIGELLGERIGRSQGAYHTTGTGSSQPKGIVACATAGVTAAGATSIAFDEIIGLVHSLDPAYREANPNVGFMMHDNIVLYVRKLKDGDGNYLWQPSVQLGVPDRLLGYPVAINQNMQSSVATGTVTMLFADFSKFLIRDVGSVRVYRLEELYRAKDLTGFMAFARSDSNTIATAAIRKLTQA